MKSTTEDAAIFREECVRWQKTFGLTDWTLAFKSEPAQGLDEAECYSDCNTRHATMTFYYGVEDALHPNDVALHEMLHLLVADLVLTTIEVARQLKTNDATKADDEIEEAENHPLVGRVEHMLIERLIKVLSKKK